MQFLLLVGIAQKYGQENSIRSLIKSSFLKNIRTAAQLYNLNSVSGSPDMLQQQLYQWEASMQVYGI